MRNKYPVQLRWSENDEAWIAEVPDLPGCMADGETEQGAVRAVQRVIREWIAMAKQMGRAIPEPTGSNPSGKFVARVSKSLHRRLQLAAKRENVSLNQIVLERLSR